MSTGPSKPSTRAKLDALLKYFDLETQSSVAADIKLVQAELGVALTYVSAKHDVNAMMLAAFGPDAPPGEETVLPHDDAAEKRKRSPYAQEMTPNRSALKKTKIVVVDDVVPQDETVVGQLFDDDDDSAESLGSNDSDEENFGEGNVVDDEGGQAFDDDDDDSAEGMASKRDDEGGKLFDGDDDDDDESTEGMASKRSDEEKFRKDNAEGTASQNSVVGKFGEVYVVDDKGGLRRRRALTRNMTERRPRTNLGEWKSVCTCDSGGFRLIPSNQLPGRMPGMRLAKNRAYSGDLPDEICRQIKAHSLYNDWHNQEALIGKRDGTISLVKKCAFWKKTGCPAQLKISHAYPAPPDVPVEIHLFARGTHTSHRNEADYQPGASKRHGIPADFKAFVKEKFAHERLPQSKKIYQSAVDAGVIKEGEWPLDRTQPGSKVRNGVRLMACLRCMKNAEKEQSAENTEEALRSHTKLGQAGKRT